MIVERRIVLLLFVLLSGSIVYCQNSKQPAASVPQVCFGKFRTDSLNNARITDILLADSLFLKGLHGRITSFEVYTRSDSVVITESAYGNRLSKNQKLLIRRSKPGQTVYIQNAMMKYADKPKIKSNVRFAFKIKN
jgi:hypothetical protein